MLKKINKFLVLLLVLPCLFMLTACKGKDKDDSKNKPQVETYSINYILNGGINNFNNPYSYTNQSETITLLNPTNNSYYSFAGWYTENTFQNRVTEISAGSTGNRTFYAKWDLVEYTITYVLNGGTNSNLNPTVYNFDTPTFVFVNPTFETFDFEGWYLDEGFNSRIYQIEKGSYGNKTLYAKWRNAVFSVSYELYGGTNNPLNPINYNISSETITLLNPTRDGYNFEGWFADKDYLVESSEIPQGSTENLTFHAKWSPIVYNLTYVLDNGTNNAENPANYTVETPTFEFKTPNKTGYDFDGWFKDEAKTEQITQVALGSMEHLTLYAKWTPKTYTITLNYDEATANNDILSIDVVYLTAFGELPTPQKDGFEFSGWWHNNVLVDENTIYEFTENITITAKWVSIVIPETYTVVFNSNEGSTIDSYTDIEFGSKISKPNNPSKNGYTFVEWQLNGEAWNFETDSVTENITLDAVWDIITYRITYYLFDGINSLSNPTEFTVETETIILADPEKEGFDFLGWYTTLEMTEQITQIEKGTTKNIYLYADWKEREVTKSTADITLVYGLPTELSSLYTDSTTTVSIGTRYELPSFNNLNIKNYFLNYYYFVDSELVELEDNIYPVDNTNDITIYAKWDNEKLLKYYYSDGLSITISGDNAIISSYISNASTVFIPEYYFYNDTDYVISKIDVGCFENNFSILKIQFLNRVSAIEIGDKAFANSTLENIDFSLVSKIGVSAFENSKISEIVSSQNLVSISNNAFKSCLNLITANLAESSTAFTVLEESAFSGCKNLVNISIPSSLTKISSYAFEGLEKITNVDFLNTISENSSLESYIFKDCTGLIKVKLTPNIKYAGTNIFSGCTNITEFELTRSFRVKSSDIFINIFGIDSVEKIIISGENFTSIPTQYFANLINLTTLRMSDLVTVVESNAFAGCSVLGDVYLSKGLDLSKFDINAFAGTLWYEQINKDGKLLVIDTTLVYIPNVSSLSNVVIDSGVTAISSSVARGNSYITTLFIPKTVKIIASSAFYGCTNLTTVEFETGSELETIESNAFYKCLKLSSINISDCTNLKNLKTYAFYQAGYSANNYINGEEGFVLPNSLELIEDSVFTKMKISKVIINGKNYVADENGVLYKVDENGNKVSIIFVSKSFNQKFYILPSTVNKVSSLAFYECNSIKYFYVNNAVKFGKNSLNSSTILITGDEAVLTFESSNHKLTPHTITWLESGYECVKDGDSYKVTILPPVVEEEGDETEGEGSEGDVGDETGSETEEPEVLQEGIYYILFEDKVLLIRVAVYSGTPTVIDLYDITEYSDIIL